MPIGVAAHPREGGRLRGAWSRPGALTNLCRVRLFRRKRGGISDEEAAFNQSLDALDEQTYGQGATEAKRVLHEEYGLDESAAAALLPFIGTQLEAGREPPQGEPSEEEPTN
jgi:hypothetical protein